jgi:hypothetical protein
MLNDNTINELLKSPSFRQKVASKVPDITTVGSLATLKGASGNVEHDLYKVAQNIGKRAYMQRRQRAIINSGLMALSEVSRG